MEGGTPNLCTPKQALHFGESDNEIARAFCSQNPAIRLSWPLLFFRGLRSMHIGSTGAPGNAKPDLYTTMTSYNVRPCLPTAMPVRRDLLAV